MNNIKNIGFAGGGFYGYAQVGALEILEKYISIDNIENVSGVSVGSIVAALFSVGYNSTELKKILFEMDFDKLIKGTSIFSYFKLYNYFGMYNADELEDTIEKLIREKTHIKYCTFIQIKVNLMIFATNLNYQKSQLFDKNHTPEMPISKAIRMSISYPLFITPVKYNGDLYGDGGETINYPITIFKNLNNTIGFTFANSNENLNGSLRKRIEISNIFDYILAIGSTMSRATYISQIDENHLSRSIIINFDRHINSMSFKLSVDDKTYMYETGKKCTIENIENILAMTIS
jgi:NTE family protein